MYDHVCDEVWDNCYDNDNCLDINGNSDMLIEFLDMADCVYTTYSISVYNHVVVYNNPELREIWSTSIQWDIMLKNMLLWVWEHFFVYIAPFINLIFHFAFNCNISVEWDDYIVFLCRIIGLIGFFDCPCGLILLYYCSVMRWFCLFRSLKMYIKMLMIYMLLIMC